MIEQPPDDLLDINTKGISPENRPSQHSVSQLRNGPRRRMSAAQRFVLALMVFLNVTVLGLLCLFVMGHINPPIP